MSLIPDRLLETQDILEEILVVKTAVKQTLKHSQYHKISDRVVEGVVRNFESFGKINLNKLSFDNLVSKVIKEFKKLTPNQQMLSIGIAKVALFQLHFDKFINLDYGKVAFLTNSSEILYKYLLKSLNLQSKKEDYEGINFKLVAPILLYNRINDVNKITDDMILEFYDYALSIPGNRRSSKYSAQYIWTLHLELFFKRNSW